MPPLWFRQITNQRPPPYTITTIDRAAPAPHRETKKIPIHEITLRVRKSGMNDATFVFPRFRPSVRIPIGFFLCGSPCTDTSLSLTNGDTVLEKFDAN
jgi:hypothetical protein